MSEAGLMGGRCGKIKKRRKRWTPRLFLEIYTPERMLTMGEFPMAKKEIQKKKGGDTDTQGPHGSYRQKWEKELHFGGMASVYK